MKNLWSPFENLQDSAEQTFRLLTDGERRQLEKSGCRAENWDTVLVEEPFLPERIQSCSFAGNIHIAAMTKESVHDGEVSFPSGLYDSSFEECRIGRGAAVRKVGYCGGCTIGNEALLSGIEEIRITPAGRNPLNQLPYLMAVMNEAGGREIFPLPGMPTAAAWLWAKKRGNPDFTENMSRITLKELNRLRRENPLDFADRVSVRNCGTITDSIIGPGSRINGARNISGVIIDSSRENPVYVGTGSMLEQGVLSPGCRVDRGSTALRFNLAENVQLDLNARIIDTWVGDNSHIACCEVRSSLLFPGHEQHHNNSFLIAANLQGLSNIAAGATAGSNHNSRAADNELTAARGFWPGLCVSLKFPSRFASYSLIVKGDYPAELSIPLPFSLINNNPAKDVLEIMPAYWWLYNKYALFRNSRKIRDRDKRVHRIQPVTSAFLAPDTAEEILHAVELLSARATATAGTMEHSRRTVRILKADKALTAYREMLTFYAASSLADYVLRHRNENIVALREKLSGTVPADWINLGGQIVPAENVSRSVTEISRSSIRFADLKRTLTVGAAATPEESAGHALRIFRFLTGKTSPEAADWQDLFRQAEGITRSIVQGVFKSREKDDTDSFRKLNYAAEEEMRAVLGSTGENPFITGLKHEMADLAAALKKAALTAGE